MRASLYQSHAFMSTYSKIDKHVKLSAQIMAVESSEGMSDKFIHP